MPGTQGRDVKSATRELVESLPDDASDVAKSVKLPWASQGHRTDIQANSKNRESTRRKR